jgi:hypothetical protein
VSSEYILKTSYKNNDSDAEDHYLESDDSVDVASEKKQVVINKYMSVHSQKLHRAPVQLGLPLEDCWCIEGFEDYVNFLCKFKERNELYHNNNLNAVRQFLHMLDMEGVTLSLKLLTSVDNINKYVRYVHSMIGYAPKTRLQKIEALKKVVKWLRMCTFHANCSYASMADRDPLIAILDILCYECNLLRPYAKTDEGRCSQEASHRATGTFLTKEEFAELGISIMEDL